MINDLAAHHHKQWSGWMRYLFDKCQHNDDGTATIPKEYADRWKRQMQTEYIDLPNGEGLSDIREAEKTCRVLSRIFGIYAGDPPF